MLDVIIFALLFFGLGFGVAWAIFSPYSDNS
jgi:hypothetical protein